MAHKTEKAGVVLGVQDRRAFPTRLTQAFQVQAQDRALQWADEASVRLHLRLGFQYRRWSAARHQQDFASGRRRQPLWRQRQ